MLLRFDPMLTARYGPVTWMPSDSTISSNSSIVPQGNTPAPSSLLFPPPLAADMDDTDTPLAAQISKPCLLPKRPLMAPFSEAAKSLLSSPLPPELVVDFKGSTSSPTGSLTATTTAAAALLRNSTSEDNVHHVPAIDRDAEATWSSIPAGRTLSDGARKSYARRKLESEDSSYDSDYECSDSHSLALNAVQVMTGSDAHSSQHEDISRTVSDTLGAEFNEYVCLHPPFQKLNETSRDDSDDSDESPASSANSDLRNEPSYSSRLEFALKLGYTEHQVHKALVKLGPQPTQNELLAELIRLASLAGPTMCGSTEMVAESQSDYSSIRPHRPLSMTSSDESTLRHIVIDGSNVAISHGHKEIFSCRGIQLCVDWFRSRGHREITVFVPMWRKETSKIDAPIANQEILLELEKERMLVFTPSRQVGGRRLVCYDDRFILQLAAETDGIVVSNDNYRDLVPENPEFRKIVEERVLMYSFVNDRFMPPEDPLGRNGPKLDRFLRKPSPAGRGLQTHQRDGPTAPPCPYGKKCTYGNKCKYFHPERGNVPQKTVSERLAEQAAHRHFAAGRKPVQQTCKTFSLPLSKDLPPSAAKPPNPVKKAPLTRTKSIVPSVSLLPPDLTEEKPVRDQQGGESTDDPSNRAAPILKSRSVENVARLSPPVRVQQQHPLPHSAMLRPPPSPAVSAGLPPPHSFTVPPPPMTTLDGFGRHNWNRASGHLPLSQQLSDPPPCMASPSSSSSVLVNDPVDPSIDPLLTNPHRKVQRQLTLNPLNPACDPRIYTLKGLAPPYPPPPFAVHSLVTRNASAPAQHGQPGGGSRASSVQPIGPNHMQRLNSTSDTQLNVYGVAAAAAAGTDWNSDPFDEWACSPPPPLPAPAAPPSVQQHSWAVRTSSLPAHQTLHLASPPQVLNDSGSQSAAAVATSSQAINQNKTETRRKLFYHLAVLFPEEQVRQVMAIMPDETSAQKICAAILALYPKDN